MSAEKKNPTVRQQRDPMAPWAVYGYGAFLAILLISGFIVAWATKRGTPVRMGYRSDDFPVQQVPREVQTIDMTLFGVDLPAPGNWHSKRVELSKYEWADPSHKTVRIPIERAMDLLVQRGHVE